MRLLETVPAELVINDSLLDLFSRGHHEGTVLNDRLVKGLASDQDELSVVFGRGQLCTILSRVGGED